MKYKENSNFGLTVNGKFSAISIAGVLTGDIIRYGETPFLIVNGAYSTRALTGQESEDLLHAR